MQIDLLKQELAISINPLVFHLRDQDFLIEKANISSLGKIQNQFDQFN